MEIFWDADFQGEDRDGNEDVHVLRRPGACFKSIDRHSFFVLVAILSWQVNWRNFTIRLDFYGCWIWNTFSKIFYIFPPTQLQTLNFFSKNRILIGINGGKLDNAVSGFLDVFSYLGHCSFCLFASITWFGRFCHWYYPTFVLVWCVISILLSRTGSGVTDYTTKRKWFKRNASHSLEIIIGQSYNWIEKIIGKTIFDTSFWCVGKTDHLLNVLVNNGRIQPTNDTLYVRNVLQAVELFF